MSVTLFSLSLRFNLIDNPDEKIIRYTAVRYGLCALLCNSFCAELFLVSH